MHLTQHELASLSFPIPIQTLSATSSHSPSSICQTSSFQFHFVFLSQRTFKRAASNATKQEKHFTRLFASQRATFSHVNGGKAKRRSKSNRKKTGAKQPIDNLPLSAELLKCDFSRAFHSQAYKKKSSDDNETRRKNVSILRTSHLKRGNWIARVFYEER